MCGDEQKPEWWKKNERYKQELDIPGYQPPRFEDSVYTHMIVDGIEETYDCTIRFVGHDSTYPDDWYVHIDGQPCIQIGRHRDANGNTVYEMKSTEFEAAVKEQIDI